MSDLQKITIGPVRLSFAHLFKPYKFDEEKEGKYRTQVLWPKDDSKINSQLKAAIEAAIEEKWPKKVPENLVKPVKDGDTQDYDSHKGMYYMTVKSNLENKPGVFDKDLNPIVDPSEVYSGCWAYVSIYLHPYDYAGKKGVTALLNNVMKWEDDEALSGGGDGASDFAGVVATSTDDSDDGFF